MLSYSSVYCFRSAVESAGVGATLVSHVSALNETLPAYARDALNLPVPGTVTELI